MSVCIYVCVCVSCLCGCVCGLLQTISGVSEGSTGLRRTSRTSVPWALSTRRAWPDTSLNKAPFPHTNPLTHPSSQPITPSFPLLLSLSSCLNLPINVLQPSHPPPPSPPLCPDAPEPASNPPPVQRAEQTSYRMQNLIHLALHLLSQ